MVRRRSPIALLLVLSALPRVAHAEPTPLPFSRALCELVLIPLGGLGLLLALALGAASLLLPKFRQPSTTGAVFSRGVLGVLAIATFALSALLVTGSLIFVGSGELSKTALVLSSGVVPAVTSLLLGLEFGYAGSRYRLVWTTQKSQSARALSFASFAVAALAGIACACSFIIGLCVAFE